MKKVLCLIAAVVMMAAVFAGCTAEQAAAPAASDSSAKAIKIGGTGPLTGGAAIYGMAVKQAAEIAVEEVNALGGLQFELKYEDDAHDAEKAVNAYNALKDWGLQISFGAVTSKPCEAIASEHFADRIFALTPSASSAAVTDGKDNVFQMCFTDPNQGLASAQYIVDNNLGSKVAVIWKNDDVYSKGVYETFTAKAKELGLEIVSDTTFTEDSQNDFSVQLTDAQNAGADIVFLPMYYTPASLILTQANAKGYAPKFFGIDGMDGILTLENFDTSLAEGVMVLTPFSADAQDEKTVSFVTKYKEKYGEIPNQFAADAYDCVYAVYQACTAAGVTADMSAEEINDKMIEQFTSMTFDGITGNSMTWSANGAVSKDPKAVVIENGEYVGMD